MSQKSLKSITELKQDTEGSVQNADRRQSQKNSVNDQNSSHDLKPSNNSQERAQSPEKVSSKEIKMPQHSTSAMSQASKHQSQPESQKDYYEKSIKENGNRQSLSPSQKKHPTDKTFMTQQNKDEDPQVWKPYDFLFPAGRLAKLVKIFDVYQKNFPLNHILEKLKLTSGFPIVNLIGAAASNRGKFYAGIARVCFRCDAVVVDSAIETGIEPHAIRRDLMLIGVAPENGAKFPKINPTSKDPNELSNGHTHIFLVNDKEKTLQWSQETLFKMQLVLKLAEGKVSRKAPRCKIVNVLLGDTPHYLDEVRLAVKYDLPIIVVKGSPVCDEIIRNHSNEEDSVWEHVEPEMQELLTKGHFYMLDSIDSEDIAQMIHFFLTFTPY